MFSRIQLQTERSTWSGRSKDRHPSGQGWVSFYHNFSACDCLVSAKAEFKAGRVPPLPHTRWSSHRSTTGSNFRVHTGRTKYGSARDLASTESPDPFRPYSSNLPRLRLDGATRLNRPSAVPTLFSGVSLNRTPALSPNVSWPLASPARRVFSAPRFQSKSLTNTSDHRASVRDWLLFPTMHPLRAQLQA